ncbi:MAG TPA: amidohydrolase family protein [Xanthobacteraceae bacterium]|nr:amidohydrolase family protein [Xanthobacteraceae bacterium]
MRLLFVLAVVLGVLTTPASMSGGAMAQGYRPKGPPPGFKGKGVRPASPGAKRPQSTGGPATAPRFAVKDRGPLRPGGLRWIDMHMHLVPARGSFSGAVIEALKLMDRAGIATAVVMPTPQSSSAYTERQYTSLLKRHRSRFRWFGGGGDLNGIVHRTDPEKVTEAVRRDFVKRANAILDAGARGFGEMAVLHISFMSGHPFEETQADHPLFLALSDVAAARNVIISMHIDLVPKDGPTPAKVVAMGNPRRLRGNVEGFERLLAHNRGARIVLEHVGADPVGYATRDLLQRLVEAHPNLYLAIRAAPGTSTEMSNLIVDTKGVLPAWLEFFERYPGRFLFGTDTFAAASGAGAGAGTSFAARNVNKLILHNRILGSLPKHIARQIGVDNPRELLGLN